MRVLDLLAPRLLDGIEARELAPGLWSALPPDLARHIEPTTLRERLLDTHALQRLVFGHDPGVDGALAQRALEAGVVEGVLALGARSGVLLAEAATGAAAPGPLFVVDRSLERLQALAARLAHGPPLPGSPVLLQAEPLELPFRPASFGAVLACDLLHRYPDPGELAEGVAPLLSDDGVFLASGLVSDRRLAAWWLRRSSGRGPVRSVLGLEGLRERLEHGLARRVRCRGAGSRVQVQTVGPTRTETDR